VIRGIAVALNQGIIFPLVLEDKMLSDIEAKIKRSAPTVIIADQHHIARAALAYLLTYDGYRVFQADSFKAAVSHINYNEDLALLIADLEMPDWRSIVRHAVKTTQALVIGMEGYHPISKIYDLRERGIRLCLQKPINYNDVRKAISKIGYLTRRLEFNSPPGHP
jgi:DNA-binding NtrC family response regulator